MFETSTLYQKLLSYYRLNASGYSLFVSTLVALIPGIIIWIVLLRKSHRNPKIHKLFLVSQVLSVVILAWVFIGTSFYHSIHAGDCCSPKPDDRCAQEAIYCAVPAVCTECTNLNDPFIAFFIPALFVGKAILLTTGTVTAVKSSRAA